MDRIHITDLIDGNHKLKHPDPQDRALVPWKKKKRESAFSTLTKRIASFFSPLYSVIKRLEPQKIFSTVKNLNIYKKLRERLVRFYIKRTVATVAVKPERLTICWQPVPLILGKVAIVALASSWFYGLAPFIGKWLKVGFDFFKLQDIYNFEFPKQPFFDAIASYLLLFIIAYYGLYFLYHQLVAFLSVLVVNEAEDKVYVVRNVFFKKALYVFSIGDLALVVLKQNIIARLLGIGTISLEKKSGELVEIKSVAGARNAVKLLSGAHGRNRESSYERV